MANGAVPEMDEGDLTEVEIADLPEEDAGDDVVDNGDGTVDVAIDPGTTAEEAPEFYGNLADGLIEDRVLAQIASDLIESTDEDKEAQAGRVAAYTDAVKRTGLDGNPIGGAEFEGASKAVLPVMQEAAIDFAASAIKELFPVSGTEGGGPAKHKVIGKKVTQARMDKALRKSTLINWQLTEQERTFRRKLEELLTQTAMAGRYYLKHLWDKKRDRLSHVLVPMDNLWLPGDASTLEDADRYTHAQHLTDVRFRERVASGMYRDLSLVTPSAPEISEAQEAADEVQGKTRDSQNRDGTRLVREIYCLLELDGDPETEGEIAPYIVSIDDDSQKILSIYRNWDIDDPNREQLTYIVEYPFIPWRDGYIGLPQLIGGLSIAGTGALRALLDSGHINNVSGALKLRGGGADKGKNIDVVPGQITEVDSNVNVDDIRKAVMPLPFNPPSTVLFSLLGFVDEKARSVVNVALEKMAESKADMPVGTVLALIEQGSKVYQAIHSRLHDAMRSSLRAIHQLNKMHLNEQTILREAGEVLAYRRDFQGPMDVAPVSDPNIFSEAQRYAQTQAVAQRATGNPLYDAYEVEKRLLEQLRIPDYESLLVKKPEPKRLNPVNENMAMAMGEPVVAFPDQDHASHLMAHFEFALNPMFGLNPVIQPTLMPSMVQHIKEHMLYLYVQSVVGASDKWIQLDPQFSGQSVTDFMDDDDEISNEMDKLLAQTSSTFLEDAVTIFDRLLPPPEVPQMPASAQQAGLPAQPPKPQSEMLQLLGQMMQMVQALQPPMPMDPAQVQAKKVDADIQTKQGDQALKREELALEKEREATRKVEAQNERMEETRLAQQGMAHETQIAQINNASDERMNVQDNVTAMAIADAEMESGERVAVQNGKGVDPGSDLV